MQNAERGTTPDILMWRTFVYDAEKLPQETQQAVDQLVGIVKEEHVDLSEEVKRIHANQTEGNSIHGTDVALSDEHALMSALLEWAKSRGLINWDEYRKIGDQVVSGIK